MYGNRQIADRRARASVNLRGRVSPCGRLPALRKPYEGCVSYDSTPSGMWIFIDRFCEAEEERKELH